jgi:hypothetical protein
VTKLGAACANNRGSVLGRISFQKRLHRFWGPPSLLFNAYWGGASSPGVMRPEREPDYSSPSSARVKNEWSYKSTFTSAYAFMTCRGTALSLLTIWDRQNKSHRWKTFVSPAICFLPPTPPPPTARVVPLIPFHTYSQFVYKDVDDGNCVMTLAINMRFGLVDIFQSVPEGNVSSRQTVRQPEVSSSPRSMGLTCTVYILSVSNLGQRKSDMFW